MKELCIATEDELSEFVAERLAAEAGFTVGQRLRRQGNGYLRSRLESFCQIATRTPVLLLTDLDSARRAPELMKQWLKDRKAPGGLQFRVAVRSIESWLLADHEAMQALLGSRATKLPDKPDELAYPKHELLSLAQRAPRAVRDDLLVRRGDIAGQGLGYNARLGAVVNSHWSPSRAAANSPSLARARIRLDALAKCWS